MSINVSICVSLICSLVVVVVVVCLTQASSDTHYYYRLQVSLGQILRPFPLHHYLLSGDQQQTNQH